MIIEPWWVVHIGLITEDDIKVLISFITFDALQKNNIV